MNIEFQNISLFDKDTLYKELLDAYSFDQRCITVWHDSWQTYLTNFESNPTRGGFVTLVDGKPVGHVTYRIDNDNIGVIESICIIKKYKGNGYGKLELSEAINELKAKGCKLIKATTTEIMEASKECYKKAGFNETNIRFNELITFAGHYYDYELAI